MDPKLSLGANVFGLIVSFIVVGALGWWLKALSSSLPLWQFAIVGLGFIAAFLGLAHLMDRQDAAKARRRSCLPSTELRRPSDQDE